LGFAIRWLDPEKALFEVPAWRKARLAALGPNADAAERNIIMMEEVVMVFMSFD
jgi:hypothetical protein